MSEPQPNAIDAGELLDALEDFLIATRRCDKVDHDLEHNIGFVTESDLETAQGDVRQARTRFESALAEVVDDRIREVLEANNYPVNPKPRSS